MSIVEHPSGAERAGVQASARARTVEQTIARARQRLFQQQEPDGHWCAELEGDTILESEYVMLMHYIGRTDDPKVRKAANYLRMKQDAHGGWSGYPGGPPDVSASVKNYFVLKLVGDDASAEHRGNTILGGFFIRFESS